MWEQQLHHEQLDDHQQARDDLDGREPLPTSTSPTTAPSAASAAAVTEYVAICKSIIRRVPTLSANVKAKVEGICNKAASGDLAGARAAAKEVCVEVIDASPISGAAKEMDLPACKAA